MPAASTRLDEEGVVIPPTRLDEAALADFLARTRNPEERRGDLRAQLAAHGLAERRVAELCERRGRTRVAAAMDALHDYSERRVRAGIEALPDGRWDAADVVEAAKGELEIPSGRRRGNVETSCRIVDAVFAAFARAVDVPAQGQRTMNNVMLGNERFTYYETIAGGQGACPNADGPAAVHVTMSNTLNTPVEALELSHPLRVERYELRRGSGASAAAKASSGSCACWNRAASL